MKLVQPILDNIEAVLTWIARHGLGADLPAYCQLETAIGLDPDDPQAKQQAALDPKGARPTILITRQCAMLTVFELAGSMDVVGDAEFERDPQRMADTARRLMEPAYQTCARIGLDLKDMLDARCERIAALCAHEVCYVLLYTHLSALGPEAFKREMKAHQARIKACKIAPMRAAQSATAIIKGILHTHQTFIDAMEKDFRATKLHVTRLSTTDAARAIRQSFDRCRTDDKWRPVLPGDPYTPRNPRHPTHDDLYLPKLSSQLCSGRIDVEGEYLCINGEYHGAATMELGPQDVHDFMRLFHRIGPAIPWRIRFSIEPGGIEAHKFKRLAASIIGFMSESNRAVKRSFDAIETLAQEGECIVSMRIAVATWGPDQKTWQERLSTLVRALQGWGIAQISPDMGVPVAGLVSTLPGFGDRSSAPKLAAPLSDSIRMLPLQRAASPWQECGSILLRTLDGKAYPFQPNSSLQTAWVDLIWAIMGSGKSVWLNTLNLGAILSPGLKRLPLITIIDIGPSSSGLIDLLQNALPPDRQHEAICVRLRNETAFAINPFDTLPGCHKPTAFDREFLISLLTALATPVGKKAPFPNAPELASMLIDAVYEKYATRGAEKHYEPTMDPIVDQALADIGFVQDESTTWWEVTDALTQADRHREARRAQRFAVPVLADCIEALGAERIRSVFEPAEHSRAMTETGMTLLDAMRMVITTALRDLPIIAEHTQFELNDQARVVSIDLEAVTRGAGADGERRAEMMYLFVRQMAARQYYLPEDIGALAPPLYHAAHRARVEAVKDEMKALCIDELHRTGGKPSFRRLLALDRREGRKHGIRVSLASQFIADFETDGEPITESAFSIYIMNAGTARSRAQAQTLFGLSDSAMQALQTEVRGAGRFLVWHQTKVGFITQVLHNAPSAIELWAFSTTNQDVGLRRRLYQRLPPAAARKILARAFPGGTAVPAIEMRRAEQGARDDENILDSIADELIAQYRHQIERACAA